MLSNLSEADLELVRKHFEQEGIPLTEENFAKYATGDVLKKILGEAGASYDMSQEEADTLVDEIRGGYTRADSQDIGIPEQYPEDLSIDALEQDKFTSDRARQMPKGYSPKVESAMDKWASEEADKMTKGKTSDLLDGKSELRKPDISELNWNIGDEVVTEVDKQKPTTNADFSGATLFGDEKTEGVESTGGGTLDYKQNGEDVLTPTTVERPTQITHVGPGPVPALHRKEGEKIPDPEEVAAVAYGDEAKNPLAALRPVVDAYKAKLAKDSTLKEGDPKKMTEEERNVAIASIGLYENYMQSKDPRMVDMKTKAGEKSVKGFVDPKDQAAFKEARDMFKQVWEADTGTSPEYEDKVNNLKNQRFRLLASKPKIDKEYREGLSAIDRRRMLDQIVKGLGQVAAGAVGSFGFQRPVPVADFYKYEARDFAPETKEAGLNYREKLGNLSNELAAIEKALASGKPQADIHERMKAVTAYMNAITKQAELSKGRSELTSAQDVTRKGDYGIARDFAGDLNKERDRQAKIEQAKEAAKRKPMNVQITDARGTGSGESTQLTQQDHADIQKLNEWYPEVETSYLKGDEKNLYELGRTFGLSPHQINQAVGPAADWRNNFPTVQEFHQALLDARTAVGRRQNIKSYTKREQKTTEKGAAGPSPSAERDIAPTPTPPSPLKTPTPTATPQPVGPQAPTSSRVEPPAKKPPYPPGKVILKQLPNGQAATGFIRGDSLVVKVLVDKVSGKIDTKTYPLSDPRAQEFFNFQDK